jgi:hypothetical protein
MPSLQVLSSVIPARDRAVELLRAAWGFSPDDPFGITAEIVAEDRLPRGSARLMEVPRELSGRTATESIAFELAGAFPLPEGTDLMALQVDRAQRAGEALLSANWTDVGCYAPEVTSFEFADVEAPQPFYVVVLSFTVSSDEFQ